MDLRPILLVLGLLLMTLSAGMLIPALVDHWDDNRDWRVFAAASGVTAFAGGSFFFMARGGGRAALSVRQAFLLTTLAWVVIGAFGALPFAFSELDLGYTDAFFESMSGVTTTGATVITGLDTLPRGLLLWRGLLQWLGGIGIVVMAVAVLPMLKIGGMQLFRVESTDTSEKILPRARQLAGQLALVYAGLSILCALVYTFGGMTVFEAIVHAMTTVATGGYSTSDLSIARFDSAFVDWSATAFMLLGGLPFVLYLQAVRGKPGMLIRDAQVRGFLMVAFLFVLAVTLYRWGTSEDGFALALRYTAFNIVSTLTGTGYATTQYDLWGAFALVAFFAVAMIGGCAGSASCGMKIFRLQIVLEAVRRQTRHMIHPNAVFTMRYNGRTLAEDTMSSVVAFFYLYVLFLLLFTLALVAMELDFQTSVSGAMATLANLGPGLGPLIGPAGNYSLLPDGAKWILCAAMLLGRLELFTVLVLFVPSFWRD